MKYKVGQVFIECSANDDGAVDFDEWHVRTIRGGKVTAIMFDKVWTWGKLSKKNGDFGWKKNIPKEFRRTWKADGKPWRMFTTKRQAARDELASVLDGDVSDDMRINETLALRIGRAAGIKVATIKKKLAALAKRPAWVPTVVDEGTPVPVHKTSVVGLVGTPARGKGAKVEVLSPGAMIRKFFEGDEDNE